MMGFTVNDNMMITLFLALLGLAQGQTVLLPRQLGCGELVIHGFDGCIDDGTCPESWFYEASKEYSVVIVGDGTGTEVKSNASKNKTKQYRTDKDLTRTEATPEATPEATTDATTTSDLFGNGGRNLRGGNQHQNERNLFCCSCPWCSPGTGCWRLYCKRRRNLEAMEPVEHELAHFQIINSLSGQITGDLKTELQKAGFDPSTVAKVKNEVLRYWDEDSC